MNKTDPVKMYVTFWGTRGSISTPGSSTEKYGGNTSCVSIHHGDTDIIIDAGTGIRNLGLELFQQTEKHKNQLNLHLLLSHTHWDHIQGLPFFVPAYLKGAKLTIYGSPKKEVFLESILQRQMDVNYFPVEMNALAADISIKEISEEKIVIDSVVIDWQEQIYHPGGCVRYRFTAGGKKIVYATDVELDQMFNLKNPKNEREKLKKEYCKFISGADLLIADGQYTAEEYPDKIGFGHTSIPLALEIAYHQKVKQIAIFHHEPQHSDNMLDRLWCQLSPKYSSSGHHMTVFWAREGMTIPV
ncbi:MAG: MBL fold metallo-hydrolase [Kiritimatiellae bacterium]|nr:MBL fold metallo-hydrolase [Kiritimatiellia bacterium]MDD5520387.1 MBL fold metallo-hydrolase [Kiritimatiellia bacterium]